MGNKNFIAAFIVVVTSSAFLSGCGEERNPRNPFAEQGAKTYAQATALTGTVHGASNPITKGRVAALNAKGGVVVDGQIQAGGHYSLAIPAGTALPLVLTAYLDENTATANKLEAVAIDPSIKNYDINPLSTAIAAKARALGGYSRQTMVEAAMTSVAVPDGNKTTAGFRGDPTKQYGGWH